MSFRAAEMTSESTSHAAFRIEFVPPFPGLQTYQVRMYPYHELLSHPFEMGRMLWI
jgi:starch phosphorylase